MQGKHWKFKCKFEYTTTGLPQQNSCVKVGVTLIVGKAQSMMNQANISGTIR
jgi:hypothetical protein